MRNHETAKTQPQHVPGHGGPFAEPELKDLRGLIAVHGINELSRRIEMRPSTLAAVAAGANVREGTRWQYRQRLLLARQAGKL
jgi:hypothetical protein